MKALRLAGQAEGARDASPSWLRCLAIVGRSHGLNLTVPQLIKDNLLSSESVTVKELLTCARQAGLKARVIELGFDDLKHLKKALPAIVKLKSGEAMILADVETNGAVPHVKLRDPDAEEGSRCHHRPGAPGGDLDGRAGPRPARLQAARRREALRLGPGDGAVLSREAPAEGPGARRLRPQPSSPSRRWCSGA